MAGLLHELEFNKYLNAAIGEHVTALLNTIGLPPKYPEAPIPDYTAETWALMILLGVGFHVATRNLKTIPTGFQHVMEGFVLALRTMLQEFIGKKEGMRHFTFIGALSVYIFFANFIGLAPYNMSPTNSLNTTVALALCSFFYYNYIGFRKFGLIKYLAHFAGPPLPWYMYPVKALIFPIELISHLARPLSLSVRLFANIMGEDIALAIFLLLVPWLVPLPMMGLAIFTSFLQTYIFIVLSMVYIAGAVAEEH